MFLELGISQQLKVEAGLESKESQLSIQVTQFCSFLWLSNKYSIVYMYHIFFFHSSVDGYLGCFHVLAIVNSAAVNIQGAYILSNYGFLWIYAQRQDCWTIVFSGISVLFSIVTIPIHILTNSVGVFLFSHTLSNIL